MSALATGKLQVRCIWEGCVITINPPLKIIALGNGCEATSPSIYLPAHSELPVTMSRTIGRTMFFVICSFNRKTFLCMLYGLGTLSLS